MCDTIIVAEWWRSQPHKHEFFPGRFLQAARPKIILLVPSISSTLSRAHYELYFAFTNIPGLLSADRFDVRTVLVSIQVLKYQRTTFIRLQSIPLVTVLQRSNWITKGATTGGKSVRFPKRHDYLAVDPTDSSRSGESGTNLHAEHILGHFLGIDCHAGVYKYSHLCTTMLRRCLAGNI
ncbi:hypothetical protein M011DRAFT_37229 [Sporormia fimetaria CBS 119925]|uniref:Uncharacterized protein n=1 Tax=Sporormia fimetaria CBS 119925 TaxID=1340428 RepID=A0A6A6VF31_9PLEO|nr:hypothetical protein M011DRAFT_37229 [Sporormia fimetaria CBS 119925]